MIKTKDFYLMKAYDIKGKYLGVIDDVCIDFFNGKVIGFNISNFALFSKKNYISIEDVVSLEDVLIAIKLSCNTALGFKKIKDMDIIDSKSVMLGVLEELIIEKVGLTIKGLIMSSGIFDKIIIGKEILLLNDCILGEDFILYEGNAGIKLKSLPHGG